MTNNLVILNEEYICDKIYVIRGKQVMIDSDLAEIYGYTTKRFNEQVKNNIDRFDGNFRFQLTYDEIKKCSRSKFSTLKEGRGHNIKYLPYAFTEEGIYMLMTVLKGELAVKQSKALIKIFKSMKDYLVDNKILEQDYINNMVLKHDNSIKYLEETFNNIKAKEIEMKKEEMNKIYFKGQTYDAYSFLLDILNSSKEEIMIIDNYIDKKIFDLISKTNKEVMIISKNMNEELIKKYQSQYNNLTIKESDEFHDRYIIIDKKILYHLGSSLKDLGNKGFSINKINDVDYINSLLNKL